MRSQKQLGKIRIALKNRTYAQRAHHPQFVREILRARAALHAPRLKNVHANRLSELLRICIDR